ncbi:hypothetical protein P4645_08695 [Lysinibacillus fusiformis]|uniref:hypothetical protein n=1 Tax=Lysinibacillus fusiformis TaxID=28031 RepID=UPI0000F38FD8|nr:hypothetical protein [Lysinibacillus fusiformis]EAZ84550.1 hypothetical protein BB14905_21403 [Bacillus sp. B14905]MED4076323.1 hypothetical protein [Lysinibacillus fusiformis]
MAIALKNNEIEVVGRERLTPALEVAKKFTAGSQARPALTYVALKENGEIHATDSHQAIILKNIHSYKEELLLNHKTLDLMKGYNYPNLSGLLEVGENKQSSFSLSKEDALQLIPAIKFIKANKFLAMKFSFTNDSIVLSVPGINLKLDGFEFDINQHKDAENTLAFTPGYLLNALEAFIKFSSNENITVHHQGALRIFIFENEEMTIGVLPRRVY